MKLKFSVIFSVIFIVLILFVSGCRTASDNTIKNSEEKNDNTLDYIEIGDVKNNTYVNRFFNIKVPVPDNWVVNDYRTRMKVIDLGAKILAENEIEKQQFELAKMNLVPLFLFSKHPLNATTGTNPNINCIAENISMYSSYIDTPEKYMENVKIGMRKSKIKMNISENYKKEMIGEIEFTSMSITYEYYSLNIYLKYYCAIIRGYALSISLTAFSEEEAKFNDEFVKKIDLKKIN